METKVLPDEALEQNIDEEEKQGIQEFNADYENTSDSELDEANNPLNFEEEK